MKIVVAEEKREMMKLLEVMIKLADKDKELTVEDFVQTVIDIYGKEETDETD